ncbi:MAG: branched-chain amino acid ABC transporter permease [Candidatus Tectomicrobia bacterium]|nr:branched-chain amino acid ABC transporter permease [Candidatus Tectomicrobia bacterium]
MHASFVEKVTDWATVSYLWAFRIAVILVVIVGSALTLLGGKYTSQHWIDFVIFGITLGSIYALIALGYTMVYGILRMINFAHGEVFMGGAFSAYFVADALRKSGFLDQNPIVSLALVTLFAMAISTGIALLVERIAYRPLRYAPRLVPLISSIGVSFFLQYTFRGLFGPGIYAYPTVQALKGKWTLLGVEILKTQVIVIVAAVAMMVGLYLIVMRTKIGKAMRAVSEDLEVASLMGIDVNYVIAVTFAIGAAMAGAAGVLYALIFSQVNFFMGFVPGIKAFTAAVLGGIGNIPGAMLGGLFLGLIESVGPALFLEGLGITAPYQLKDAIAFTMLVLVLIFRPSGILGERLIAKKA